MTVKIIFLTVENKFYVADIAGILLLADFPLTRRLAETQIIIKAHFIRKRLTGAERKNLTDDLQSLADERWDSHRGHKTPRQDLCVCARIDPHHRNQREFLLGDLNKRIRFSVFKLDIIFGLVLLNETGF